MIVTGYENYRQFYDTAIFNRHVFKNGVTIWMQKVPIQTDGGGILIACFPGIGSIRDPQDKTGIAHFFEHIPFRGTRNKSTIKDLVVPIEAIGGGWNASTSMWSTKYHVTAGEDFFPLAVETVFEMSTAPIIRDHDVIKERGVILQERRQKFADPGVILAEDIDERLYGKDSIFHHPIGSAESISGMTGDDLRVFQAKFYRANNLHLICGGAFARRNDALDVLEDIFGTLPSSEHTLEPLPVAPNLLADKLKLKNPRYGCDSLTLGWQLPRSCPASDYALKVLASATGNGFSAPLVVALREKCGITYDSNLMTANQTPAPYPWVFRMKVRVEERQFDPVYVLTMQALEYLSTDEVIGEHRKRQISRKSRFTHPITACQEAVHEILIDGQPLSFARSADENDVITLESVFAWRDYLLENKPIDIRATTETWKDYL